MPGLRPIGVGEVLRRIAGKVVMSVVKGDVLESTGSLQLCVGQDGGCEAAVHAMRMIFEEVDTEAVLLVDAANAFNSMNRNVMLHNIKQLCPAIYMYSYNCYSTHARLFVLGGQELASKEGTTQGDPTAMALYGLGLIPFMDKISENIDASTSKQVAYADDLTGGGKLHTLRLWWDAVLQHGPKYGYYAEPSKSWLIVKQENLEEATKIFENSGVKITAQGKRHLGAVVGTNKFKNDFVKSQVDQWCDQIRKLATIAETQPQSAYSAFTTGLRHRYSFFMRTIPDISELFKPLEDEIHHKLIPALTYGRQPTAEERELLSLPARLGGLGITNPVKSADQEYVNSQLLTKPLTTNIINQVHEYTIDQQQITLIKSEIRASRRTQQKLTLEQLRSNMSSSQKKLNDICSEQGSSKLVDLFATRRARIQANQNGV